MVRVRVAASFCSASTQACASLPAVGNSAWAMRMWSSVTRRAPLSTSVFASIDTVP